MLSLFNKIEILTKHLSILDKTFKDKSNYSNQIDFEIYTQNEHVFKKIASWEKLKATTLKTKKGGEKHKSHLSFADEIYHEHDRQMKLADLIEYILFSRGVYYLFQSNKFKRDRVSKFIEINLRLVNILMIYESLTVDKKLRDAFLKNLESIIGKEKGYTELLNWNEAVGLSEGNSKYRKDAPNVYFDTLLPKTAGGLWHEILVYCFILKYNIGYIFPLLLTQKPISLTSKLSPPDLVILHNKTYRYYGIEIGALKERQSGGFMAPSGIPIIPIDTLNSRTSDRCPSCNKWIGICPKVIRDFSNTDLDLAKAKVTNEIRCLIDCDIFTLEEQLNGACKYMKFKYKNSAWKFEFANGHHHHYHCCLKKNPILKYKIKSINSFPQLKELSKLRTAKNLTAEQENEKKQLQEELLSRYSFIKTHSIFYSELTMLYKMNKESDDSSEDNEEEIETA
jgi:hypothetical protein